MPISNLYQKQILDLNAQPFHYEKRLDAQHIIEAYNPLCGDKFKLFLDIEYGYIKNAHFYGHGCAISKAASSVLIEKIEKKSVKEALDIINTYFLMLNTEGGGINEENEASEEMKAFVAVKDFPERMTCATLSWQAAEDFFKKKLVT